MSHVHLDEFDRIKREHAEVVRLLSSFARKGQKKKPGQKSSLSDLPAFDPIPIEAAIATANDAYALLLIATAERFMRAYLTSQGIPVGAEPKLSTLIDRCRKEFNKTNPRAPIRISDANEVQDLRRQRNEYAHSYGASVFPTIGRVVTILGRFFAPLP